MTHNKEKHKSNYFGLMQLFFVILLRKSKYYLLFLDIKFYQYWDKIKVSAVLKSVAMKKNVLFVHVQ